MYMKIVFKSFNSIQILSYDISISNLPLLDIVELVAKGECHKHCERAIYPLLDIIEVAANVLVDFVGSVCFPSITLIFSIVPSILWLSKHIHVMIKVFMMIDDGEDEVRFRQCGQCY